MNEKTSEKQKSGTSDLHGDAVERLMIYRWLSSLFAAELDGEAVEFHSSGPGGDLLRNLRGVSEYSEEAGILLNILEKQKEKGDDERPLSAEYAFLFHGAGGRSSVPPYESVYMDEDGAMCGPSEQAVRKLMKAHGLSVSDIFSEPADHIALELEFMAFLAGLTAEAAAGSSGKKKQAGLLSKQRKFLEEHLLRWVPRFAEGCRNSGASEFYAAASRLALKLLQEDGRYLNASVPKRN